MMNLGVEQGDIYTKAHCGPSKWWDVLLRSTTQCRNIVVIPRITTTQCRNVVVTPRITEKTG